MSMRPLKILHVEDNEEDLILFQRACGVAGLSTVFHPVFDGVAAIAYLEGKGEFSDRSRHPLPDVIILDLNLPRMNGWEVLKWVREKLGLSLPVLIFTVSGSLEDKKRAMAAGATGYYVKPTDFETLVRLMESFRKFEAGNTDKNEEST
jgi:CheY-like chemotaxis protein